MDPSIASRGEMFSIMLRESRLLVWLRPDPVAGEATLLMTLPAASNPTLGRPRRSRLSVVLVGEQIAHREAPIGAPAVRNLSHLVVSRRLVEAVRSLDRAPEREVARKKDVRPIERHEQEPARRPRPDTRNLCQGRLDLVVRHPRERLVA